MKIVVCDISRFPVIFLDSDEAAGATQALRKSLRAVQSERDESDSPSLLLFERGSLRDAPSTEGRSTHTPSKV